MTTNALDPAKAFPAAFVPAGNRRAVYHAMLAKLRGVQASGVYIITSRTRSRVLYVGESHSGRLYDTITRHFRAWKRRNDPNGRRYGGTTYDRLQVCVHYVITRPEDAAGLQYAAIQAFNPPDNQVTGTGNVGPTDPDTPAWL